MNLENPTLLNVSGMSCPSCIRHINAALRELDGVTDVEVHLAEGKVAVEHDPQTAPVDTLVTALREAGYESTPTLAA